MLHTETDAAQSLIQTQTTLADELLAERDLAFEEERQQIQAEIRIKESQIRIMEGSALDKDKKIEDLKLANARLVALTQQHAEIQLTHVQFKNQMESKNNL